MKTTKYEQELRIARQGQKQRAPNGEAAASPEDGKTSGGTHNTINSCDASAAATFEEVEARERSLEEKLLEAKHALEERDALNEEARRIREELASVKVGAEVRHPYGPNRAKGAHRLCCRVAVTLRCCVCVSKRSRRQTVAR